MKKTISMTYARAMMIMQQLSTDTARATWSKRLPVKILLAKNKSLNDISVAAIVAQNTLADIASQFGIEPVNVLKDKNPEVMKKVQEVLNAKFDASIYMFPESLLTQCDGNNFDIITDADLATMAWLVEMEE